MFCENAVVLFLVFAVRESFSGNRMSARQMHVRRGPTKANADLYWLWRALLRPSRSKYNKKNCVSQMLCFIYKINKKKS